MIREMCDGLGLKHSPRLGVENPECAFVGLVLPAGVRRNLQSLFDASEKVIAGMNRTNTSDEFADAAHSWHLTSTPTGARLRKVSRSAPLHARPVGRAVRAHD